MNEEKMNILILDIVIYIITVLSVLILKKHELTVAALHLVLLLIIVFHSDVKSRIAALIVGLTMTVISYICVKYYGMWTHAFTQYTIPLWMPITWMMMAFFVRDAHSLVSRFVE